MQTRTATLAGLAPYMQYRVVIVAANSAGYTVSTVALVTTLEAAPGPVENVVVLRTTDEAVELSWSPPALPNGIILGYVVRWFASGAEGHADELNVGTNTSAIIADLIQDTTYSIAVGVRNGANTTVGGVLSLTTCTGLPDAATNVAAVVATTAIQVSDTPYRCHTYRCACFSHHCHMCISFGDIVASSISWRVGVESRERSHSA